MADNVLSLILRARDEATANVAKVSKSLDALGKSATGAHTQTSMLSSVLSGVGAGVGIAAFMGVSSAASKMADVFGDATRAAVADEASVRKLTQTLRENAPSWNGSTVAIERFTRAGQQLAFTDDAIRESIGKLTVSTGDVGRAMDLTRLSMDLARLKNIDLASASDMVNKALGGQIGALRRVLPFIDANATSTQALAAIQQAAQGQAESYAATTEGELVRSQIALEEALESLGRVTMPLVGSAAGSLAEQLDWVGRAVDDVNSAIADLADVLPGAGADFDALGTVLMTVPFISTWVRTNKLRDSQEEAADAAAVHEEAITSLLSGMFQESRAAGLLTTDVGELAAAQAAAAAAAWIAAVNSGTAVNAYVNEGRAALWAAEKTDILADARRGADVTAKIASTGAWTATTAYYAQAAGLERAGMGVSALDARVAKLTPTVSRATGGVRTMTDALSRLKDKTQAEMTRAFDLFRDAALAALDAVHAKTLRAIDDAQRLADAQYEAARSAIQGPVDAARAALDAAQAARELADAQREVNEAYASGDAGRIASATSRLADIQARQAIDAMQAEADAKLAALATQKAIDDKARADAIAAENLSYEEKKKVMQADLDLIEEQLKNLEALYGEKTGDLINVMKRYSADFTKLGKAMGVSYASGVVEGLDSLIPKIAQKVAELLLGVGTTDTGEGSGGGVAPDDTMADYSNPPKPPGKASGGAVAAWQPYIVGERGPELFVPRSGGTIVPNGAGDVNINVTVSGPAIFDPLGIAAQQVASAMLPALRREVARQGVTL